LNGASNVRQSVLVGSKPQRQPLPRSPTQTQILTFSRNHIYLQIALSQGFFKQL
jgi:hypothetical protein